MATLQERLQDQADAQEKLHIFVNRRKFGIEQGVRETMNGREIAALVNTPADNAVVKLENGPEKREVGLDEAVELKKGMQFLVTRRTVEGGYGS